MIEAFFFDNERLFGCYHPPSDHSSTQLLVICPPLFDEYRRCYRGITELAKACADGGMHVLRFDYYGTGESWGALAEVTDLRWIRDIEAAIEEGLALTGAESVTIAGFRFGASLAAHCTHPALKRLILCEPLKTGQDFINLQKLITKTNEIDHKLMARSYGLKTEAIDYAQFKLSDELVNALLNINLEDAAQSTQADIQIVSTQKQNTENATLPTTYAGVEYTWPVYHSGEFVSKPLLETIATKVLEV